MNNDDSDRVAEYHRAKQFKLGAILPGSWESKSLRLKHAASRLRGIQFDAILRSLAQQKAELEAGAMCKDIRELEGQELQDCQDGALSSVYFLLMGYAIENLLKGMLMLQHPEYFKPAGKMKDIKSHRLVSLCQRCGIQLSDEESASLDQLTASIEWAGKYPVPLDGKDMQPIGQGGLAWIQSGEALKEPPIYERVENLYVKIWDEFERMRKATSTHSE